MRRFITLLLASLIVFSGLFACAENEDAESVSFWNAEKKKDGYQKGAFLIESAFIPTSIPGRTVQGMDTIDVKLVISIDNPTAVYPMNSIDEFPLKQWSARAYFEYKGNKTGRGGIASQICGYGSIELSNNRNKSITIPLYISVTGIDIPENKTSELINYLCSSTSISAQLNIYEEYLSIPWFEIKDSSGIHAAMMSMGFWGVKEGTKIHTDFNDLGTGTVVGLSTVQINSADQTILRIQFPGQPQENWFPYPDCLDQGWAYIVLE